MKLYYVVGSPNCRKVHAVVNHLGLKPEFEYFDFFNGELRQPEYLTINPNGLVPSLRDGDLTLWESNAIMQYLADSVPGNTLLPQDRKVRADVTRWQNWELAHLNKAFAVLSIEAFVKPNVMKAPSNEHLIKWAQDELARHVPVLETALKGRRYLVGDGLTLADYSVAHLEMFKDDVPFDWKPYPNVNSYYARMREVPHWASTAASSPQAMGRRPK
jgi:glutathione S-transferase